MHSTLPKGLLPQVGRFSPTHVGNLVEVKNPALGAGSKANQLTYIGDVEVGMRETRAA